SFTSTANAGGTVEAIHQARVFGRSNRLALGVEYAYADARVRVFDETRAGQRTIDSDIRDGLATIGGWVLNTLEVGRGLLVSGDQPVGTGGAPFDYVRHTIGRRTPE